MISKESIRSEATTGLKSGEEVFIIGLVNGMKIEKYVINENCILVFRVDLLLNGAERVVLFRSNTLTKNQTDAQF